MGCAERSGALVWATNFYRFASPLDPRAPIGSRPLVLAPSPSLRPLRIGCRALTSPLHSSPLHSDPIRSNFMCSALSDRVYRARAELQRPQERRGEALVIA